MLTKPLLVNQVGSQPFVRCCKYYCKTAAQQVSPLRTPVVVVAAQKSQREYAAGYRNEWSANHVAMFSVSPTLTPRQHAASSSARTWPSRRTYIAEDGLIVHGYPLERNKHLTIKESYTEVYVSAKMIDRMPAEAAEGPIMVQLLLDGVPVGLMEVLKHRKPGHDPTKMRFLIQKEFRRQLNGCIRKSLTYVRGNEFELELLSPESYQAMLTSHVA